MGDAEPKGLARTGVGRGLRGDTTVIGSRVTGGMAIGGRLTGETAIGGSVAFERSIKNPFHRWWRLIFTLKKKPSGS
jgi:hypothetical protein